MTALCLTKSFLKISYNYFLGVCLPVVIAANIYERLKSRLIVLLSVSLKNGVGAQEGVAVCVTVCWALDQLCRPCFSSSEELWFSSFPTVGLVALKNPIPNLGFNLYSPLCNCLKRTGSVRFHLYFDVFYSFYMDTVCWEIKIDSQIW